MEPQATHDLSELGRRVVLATHRRSGTHLTLDLLRRQFPDCRARKKPFQALESLYLNLDALGAPRLLALDRARRLLGRAARPIVKTHASPALEEFEPGPQAFARAVLADADVIAVHRDVRDVLASHR